MSSLSEPDAPRNIRIFSDERANWVSWEQTSDANRVLVYRCKPCKLLNYFPSAPGSQGFSIWPPQRSAMTFVIGEYIVGVPGGPKVLGFYEIGSVHPLYLPEVIR